MQQFTRDAFLSSVSTLLNSEKNNVLAQVAAGAFFIRYNEADGKDGLKAAYLAAGYARPKKPGAVTQTALNRVAGAAALLDKSKDALTAMLEGAASVDDAIAQAVAHISLAYLPRADFPLTVDNKFLPMLTLGWSAERCEEALAGKEGAADEGANPGQEGGEEAETAKEEKAPESLAVRMRRAIESIFPLLDELGSRDSDACLAASTYLETFAAGVMRASGVYSIVSQHGHEVTLGAADEALAERVSVAYHHATNNAEVLKEHAKRMEQSAVIAATAQADTKRNKQRKAA